MNEKKKSPFTKADNFITSDQDFLNAMGKGEELLPCPFCGKHPISAGRKNERNGNIVYTVQCSGGVFDWLANMVTCLGGTETVDAARKEVAQMWNRRVKQDNNIQYMILIEQLRKSQLFILSLSDDGIEPSDSELINDNQAILDKVIVNNL